MTTYLGTATGSTPAVQGDTTISAANGVKGTSTTDASAVYGVNTNASGAGAGVNGASSASNGWGLYGSATGGNGIGAYGSGSGSSGIGVYGTSSDSFGTGVQGFVGANSTSAYAVWGSATYSNAYAGYFGGRVVINGSLSCGALSAGFPKSFRIDHPLDPENKVLMHACIESPEVKNFYDGMGTADPAGEIAVQMPDYFDAINRDFRYQLTAVGKPAPGLHVKRELAHGRFTIAGAAPGQKVCWLVTGIRNDALVAANPFVVEAEKPAEERGFYIHPEAHGQPSERGIEAERERRRAERTPPPTPAAPT